MEMRAVLAFAMIMAVLSGCAPADERVKIGFIAPLSGDAAVYGQNVREGAELAARTHGGAVEIIFEDTGCEGAKAATAVQKLIAVDQVVAVLGEVCSSATLAAAPIASQHGVVMVSPASTVAELSGEPWVFRTIPVDAHHAQHVAGIISADGHDTLAVLYSNEPYGIGYARAVQEHFDGTVVLAQAVERDALSVKTELAKVGATRPDAVLLATNSPAGAAAMIKQIRELGIDAAIYGAEALQDDSIIAGAGGAAEGLIVSSLTSGTDAFKREYAAYYGEEPGLLAAQGYDAMMALLLALDRSAQTGERLDVSLRHISFEGATGPVDFDDSGDLLSAENEVWIVRGGTFVRR